MEPKKDIETWDSNKIVKEVNRITRDPLTSTQDYSFLNRACKTLLRRGGVIPSVLHPTRRRMEDFSHENGEGHFNSRYELLLNNQLDAPIRASRQVELSSLLHLRCHLTRRRLRGLEGNKSAEWIDQPVQINDVLHFFTTDDEDYGWVFPQETDISIKEKTRVSRDKTAARKKTEGMVWENQRLNEVVRRIINGEQGIVKEPTILSRKIRGLSIIYESRRGASDFEVDRGLIKNILSGNYQTQGGKPVAGGRTGLNPALLYSS